MTVEKTARRVLTRPRLRATWLAVALNELTTRFARGPLDFCRLTSINPPAQQDAPLRHGNPVRIGKSTLRFFSDPLVIEHGRANLKRRFATAEVAAPIAWIRLSADPVFTGAATFDLEFANDADEVEDRIRRGDRLPVYYLPWQPDHIVRVTIPQVRETSIVQLGANVETDPSNPHLFFTAGLTGCSVFAYGDPRRPTVAHIGAQASTPYGDDCARFWRELLLVERFQRGHHGGVAHEANVTHYMGETATMQRFTQWLQTKPSRFTVEHVLNYGAAFGIRYGALWTFYLQENASVSRYEVVRRRKQQTRVEKGFLGLSWFDRLVPEEVVVEERRGAGWKTVPLRVWPFYPQGGGHATLRETFKQAYA
jgi:hypothetical protein